MSTNFEGDTMDLIDNYGNNEQIWQDSKTCNSPELHDYAQLNLENYCGFHDLKPNQTLKRKYEILADEEKQQHFLSEYSSLPKYPPEKLRKISLKTENDKMVNFSKLINQLFNAKVFIEKMCVNSQRDEKSKKKRVMPNEFRISKYSVLRYCPKCNTRKVDKHRVSVKKSCPKCDTILRYLCSKCNNKFYLLFQSLKSHSQKCGLADYRSKKQNEYLVKEGVIDFSTFITRYCLTCNESVVCSTRWKEEVCPKCDRSLLYQCNKCKAQYSKAKSLWNHMQIRCYAGQFKCNQCDFTTLSSKGMHEHVVNVHCTTKSHCPKCDSEFKNRRTFLCHVQFCGREPKFSCNSCSFKTKHRGSLKNHKKIVHSKL